MKLFSLLIGMIISFNLSARVTLVSDVDGYTLTNSGALVNFTHLAMENGKVLEIGDASLVFSYPQANIIEGNKRVMLPGLIDAHGHLLGLGEQLLQVDVRDTTSAKDAAQRVSKYAQNNPELKWLIGRGWNQVLWPGKQFPTATTLDEQIQERPVWLTRVDGHAGWANSKALEIAGIDKDTLDPKGGKIIRDAQGNPTGVLIDYAMNLLEGHLPKPDQSYREKALKAASDHLLSLGITSMHDAGISKPVYDFYQQTAQQGDLGVRVYAMLSASDPNLENMLKAGYIRDKKDFLSIRSVKAYGDGALGSRGAAMLEDYSDDPGNHGLLLTSEEQMPGLFDLVLSHDFQLNYHAIGDKANQLLLDNFARAYKTVGGTQHRHRIEHAQVVTLDDIKRFKQLDVIPSMQPTHATSDMNMAKDRIGEARLAGAYAWQRFLQQGSKLALGSDFPVELANPFFGIHAAVTRQDRNNQPVKGWRADQALSLVEAFKGFTVDAAYSSHQEDILGGLTAGKWADFILVDQNIFSVDPKNLWKTKVLETWVAGEKVYQAK